MESDRAAGWGSSLLLGIGMWWGIIAYWPNSLLVYLALLALIAAVLYPNRR